MVIFVFRLITTLTRNKTMVSKQANTFLFYFLYWKPAFVLSWFFFNFCQSLWQRRKASCSSCNALAGWADFVHKNAGVHTFLRQQEFPPENLTNGNIFAQCKATSRHLNLIVSQLVRHWVGHKWAIDRR